MKFWLMFFCLDLSCVLRFGELTYVNGFTPVEDCSLRHDLQKKKVHADAASRSPPAKTVIVASFSRRWHSRYGY